MAAPILPVSGITLPDAIRPAGQSSSGGALQDVLSGAIQKVESFSQNASASVERFLSGENEEIHTPSWQRNKLNSPWTCSCRRAIKWSVPTRKSCACKCRLTFFAFPADLSRETSRHGRIS